MVQPSPITAASQQQASSCPTALRQFIRHPASIPITAEYADVTFTPEILLAHNVGVGGLAFTSDRPFDAGTILHLKISHLRPAFETVVRVVWCHAQGEGAETGVEFLSQNEAYRARMVEQVCHIEAYRLDMANTKGRSLTPGEAAVEWIEKFAASFPNLNVD